jgi:hypothetical protein
MRHLGLLRSLFWCKLRGLFGSEFNSAMLRAGSGVTVIHDVREGDRVSFGGQLYNVVSVHNATPTTQGKRSGNNHRHSKARMSTAVSDCFSVCVSVAFALHALDGRNVTYAHTCSIDCLIRIHILFSVSFTCIHIHVQYKHACTSIQIHVHLYRYMCIYTHTNTYILYTHTSAHACTYIHIHVHIYKHKRSRIMHVCM